MANGHQAQPAPGQPRQSRQPRGWKVTSRLRVIVAAPLVAVLGFAGVALATGIKQTDRATKLGDLVALGDQAGDLAYTLQRERAAAAMLLTSDNPNNLDVFLDRSIVTDQAVARYLRLRAKPIAAPAASQTILHRLTGELAGLAGLRQQARSASQGSVSAVTFGYRIAIADLLDFRRSVALAGLSPDLADAIRADAALSDTVEAAGLQQVAVLRAIAAGEVTPAMEQDITAARTGFTEASLSFQGLARRSWQVWWEHAGSGNDVLTAQRLQDQVGRTATGTRLQVGAEEWVKAMDVWAARLFDVQQRVDAVIRSEVADARDAQLWRVGVEAVAMAVALLLTMFVTAAVARQITRQLRRLRDAANRVAFERLPAVVDELRAADVKGIHPDEVAHRSAGMVRAALTPNGAPGADEIGEVAQAFTEVHRAAVRTAAEQAIMRANMADIFVHLSRREQRLVDSVLAKVDVVERDETDPERLRHLYELDNLATRMARINANLLVLGGVGVGRVRTDDVPLRKIIQAALSQIQHYTRIRLGVIDDGVAVVADAVDDIVHLFAELMDNATAYSPPDSDAWVTGRVLGDRVIVQIGDEGVGLPQRRRSQLNDLLANPPAVDVATVRSMGLVVVGHLASRYSAQVELRSGPRLGTIAEVTLPPSVFRPIQKGVYQPLPLPDASSASGSRTHNSRDGGRDGLFGDTPLGNGAIRSGAVGNGAVRNGMVRNGRDGTGDPARDAAARDAAARDAAARDAARDAAARDAAAHDRALAQRDADSTEELPIFQEVNSWFSPDLHDDPIGSVPRDDQRVAVAAVSAPPAGRPQSVDWRTGADPAWQAAAALANPAPPSTTGAGLPQRVPQQRLVPTVLNPTEQQRNADHRDPVKVAAALSAYARGVAGRQPSPSGTHPPSAPSSAPSTHPSSAHPSSARTPAKPSGSRS